MVQVVNKVVALLSQMDIETLGRRVIHQFFDTLHGVGCTRIDAMPESPWTSEIGSMSIAGTSPVVVKEPIAEEVEPRALVERISK